jgi:hypothetical protein
MKLIFALMILFSAAVGHSQEKPADLKDVEAPVAEPQVPLARPIEPEKKTTFAIGLMFGNDSLMFTSSKYKSPTASGSLTVNVELASAAGVFVEGMHLENPGFGYSFGMEFEPDRDVKNIKYTGSGGSFTSTTSGTTLKYGATTPYANVVFKSGKLLFPVGLHYSIHRLSGTTATEVGGGHGARVGIGVQASDRFYGEIQARGTSVNLKTTVGSETLDYGDSFILGFRVIGKISF